MIKFAVLFPCAIFSGCVSTYIPPAAANSSTLSVTSTMNVFRIFENGQKCSNPVRIPGEFLKNGSLIALPIKEGKELALHAGYASGAIGLVTTCQIMVSFIPKEQSDYELRFSYERQSKQCRAELYRKDRLTRLTAADASLRMRERLVPFLESQPFCVALNNSQ